MRRKNSNSNILDAASSGEAIARGVELLRAGKLVAFPTETVYGLGADAGNPRAVRAIFAAKGRPADHPVIVHLADDGARLRTGRARCRTTLVRSLPPSGPVRLTLILPRSRNATDDLTGGQDRIGLRVPSHPGRAALLRGSPRPAAPASPRRRRTASAASRQPPRSTSPTISAMRST